MKAPVSVFIMTLNEERNLRRCVESLDWAGDIIVLDSGSSDGTCRLAEDLGCRVVSRKLLSWSEHQAWAVQNLPFRHEWVLNIDADEVVPPDLAAEIQQAISAENAAVAYRFRRKDYFLGTWLRHASFYPLWIVRLYRPGKVSFERLVNPVTSVYGPVGNIQSHLDHYPFSKGVAHWFDRHNSYSTLEALEDMKKERVPLSHLLSGDVGERRRALKSLFSRLPCRPLLKFAYLYFAHRGFLDGRAGLYYSVMQAFYEFMISVKLVETRDAAPEAPIVDSLQTPA